MNYNEAKDQRRGGRETVEARRRRRLRPTVMALEDRMALATYTVTGLTDAAGAVTDLGGGNFSATTLRAAINAATADAAPDTIQFDPSLTATGSATINL